MAYILAASSASLPCVMTDLIRPGTAGIQVFGGIWLNSQALKQAYLLHAYQAVKLAMYGPERDMARLSHSIDIHRGCARWHLLMAWPHCAPGRSHLSSGQ